MTLNQALAEEAFAKSTAIGQFRPGVLSATDTQGTAQSAGELRGINYTQSMGKTQTIIARNDSNFNAPSPLLGLTEDFALKAQQQGIPVSRTQSGVAYVATDAPLPLPTIPTSPRSDASMFGGGGGISLGMLALGGLALFALSR